jgi:hypothetical protein
MWMMLPTKQMQGMTMLLPWILMIEVTKIDCELP